MRSPSYGKVTRDPAHPPRCLHCRGGPEKKRSRQRFLVAEMSSASVRSRPRSLAQLSRQTIGSAILSPCTGRKSSRSSTRPCRQSSTLLACSQPRPRHTSTGVTNACRARASAAAATTRELGLPAAHIWDLTVRPPGNTDHRGGGSANRDESGRHYGYRERDGRPVLLVTVVMVVCSYVPERSSNTVSEG